ncbi:hypothetical protein [Vibrio cincinnatiensis]|uniref:hypothetical protein n=1 Tax=Vibrio cincinnatiensis TaxID=675 RepID=UPI001EDDE4DC|nr:hypothetical protein [Vibrio cincinnatiensis]MCG3728746.1 hypothetical protein [Vibrio cincinnatiensis]
MPEAYCSCCHKITPHKVVMRRCQTSTCSGWQSFQQFMSLLMHGEHYYKMEKQGICRLCNQPSSLPSTNFSRAKVI